MYQRSGDRLRLLNTLRIMVYLLLFPFHALGMAALIGVGTVVMMLLGRREDIITTGITTAVVMVVAAMNPQDVWQQPLLRLVDTIVGIAVGIAFMGKASLLFVRKQGTNLKFTKKGTLKLE
jgi:uncharacterized membrane protein YccC